MKRMKRKTGEDSRPAHLPESAQAEPDVVYLIKKLQQHLVFLERKLDLLIRQSETKPVRGEHVAPSARFPGGRPYRHSGRAPFSPSGEKRFDRGRPFEKRPSEKPRNFAPKERTPDTVEGTVPGPKSPFKTRHSGKKKGRDKGTKPFEFKRRERER